MCIMATDPPPTDEENAGSRVSHGCDPPNPIPRLGSPLFTFSFHCSSTIVNSMSWREKLIFSSSKRPEPASYADPDSRFSYAVFV